MSEFASILYRLRDMKRSLITYEECAELQRKVLGSDHPDTLSTLNNLAILYSTIHLYHKALPLCQEVYLSQVRVLGLYHRETMGAMSNLASALYKSGDYRTACPMFEQCLRQRQLILGEDHPDTCSAINNLAMVYIAMGDDETAYGLLEAVLQARKRILGNLHHDTQASAANLIEMYRKIGAYDKVVAVKEFLDQPLISTPVFLTDTGAAGGGSSSTMTSHRRASIKVSMGNVSNNINSEDSLSGHTSESTPLTSPIRTPFSAASRGSATIFYKSN
jgi:tetratricopeptide (TPR) repeat protein